MSRVGTGIGCTALSVMALCPVAHGQTTQLAAPTAATSVSSYAGNLAYSQRVGRRYKLMFRLPTTGQVIAARVPTRGVPFDVDLGPDSHGRVVATYSRCRQDPSSFSLTLPTWTSARGCRVYSVTPTGREHKLTLRIPRGASAILPSRWRDHVAYATYAPIGSFVGNLDDVGPKVTLRLAGIDRPHATILKTPPQPASARRPTHGRAYGGVPEVIDLRGETASVVWRWEDHPQRSQTTEVDLVTNSRRLRLFAAQDEVPTCRAAVVGGAHLPSGTVGFASLGCEPGVFTAARSAAQQIAPLPLNFGSDAVPPPSTLAGISFDSRLGTILSYGGYSVAGQECHTTLMDTSPTTGCAITSTT